MCACHAGGATAALVGDGDPPTVMKNLDRAGGRWSYAGNWVMTE